MEWQTTEPPFGQTIELEDENGVVLPGIVVDSMSEALNTLSTKPPTHDQHTPIYRVEGKQGYIVVKRWRPL